MSELIKQSKIDETDTIRLLELALRNPEFYNKFNYWVNKRQRVPSQAWLTANIRLALRSSNTYNKDSNG